MNRIKPHIKFRAVVLVLVMLSVISTIHILWHYHSDIGINQSLAFFQVSDSVGIKEVGFVDFVVEAFRRVVVNLI